MKKKILVVDDNQQMLELMASLLKEEGHEVVTAGDGFSALNLLTVFSPDIMFVDLVMPNIGGDKLIKIVRKMEHLKNCHIVLVTAAAAEMEIDYAEIGADNCIAKGPFGSIVEHVLSAVNESNFLQRGGAHRSIAGLEDVYSRQMTKELLSQNRHWESILEGIPEGIMEVYSGKIVYANAAAVDLCGVRQEELLATYFVDLFNPVDQQRMKSLLWLGSEKSGDIRPDPVTIDGRQVMIKTLSKQSQGSTSILMISDVTYLNRLEFQRRYTRKMGAVTSMAGSISRAFRKPLQKIQQVASGLLDEMDAEHPHVERIREIKRFTREMDDLIHQLSLVRGVEKATSESAGKPIQTGKETVLLVDRSEIVSDVNRLILEELGYKVMVAATGKAAIEKYSARSDKKYNRIDLLIVDEFLPDMDAVELCDRIKEIDPDAKILMSGEPATDTPAETGRSGGAHGFIHKPFNIRQASSRIRETLDTPSSLP